MTLPLASHAISAHRSLPLTANWQLTRTAPDSISSPTDLDAHALSWRDAVVPGTVAQSIHTDIGEPGLYDREDWWYRTTFFIDASQPHARLRFEGLASLADIWLNDQLLLSTDNMFRAYVVDITDRVQPSNELVICFRAVGARLDKKMPRPRWKTALTSHQNLRWIRTTLLGRMPAWSPPIHPVGPWQPITLEIVNGIDIVALDVQTQVSNTTGIVKLDATLTGSEINAAHLVIGDRRELLSIDRDASQQRLQAQILIADAPLWWPHTHGAPTLLPCHLELSVGNRIIRIDCGKLGFKSIDVDRRNGHLQFLINGEPIFCRGACWTVSDMITLRGSEPALREALQLARDANFNLLRVGGTMAYESDLFYSLCDELGIMVWQDFMFANMDYPIGDDNFRNNIDTEATQLLQRLQRHACVTAYCGGSEIEQQAAMLGLPASEWSNEFFAEALPHHCDALHRGVPYFRGSPSEGALPFHVSSGIAHYYGIGAYRRPLSDAKHAGVKFATECLGISNVPDLGTMTLLSDGALPRPHHPIWKARVPRDAGSGYDFEDIRDFYLRDLFKLDPVQLRSEDPDRYYAISRTVSGEVMLRTYAEWRRADNPCTGALIWFYKDLWPGAGWGVIDSENQPKAALHYLRRALAPRALLMTDEGQDGIKLHVINEQSVPLHATITVEMYRAGNTRLLSAERAITVEARGSYTEFADAIIGHFTDIAYNYHFGPPQHDVVVARLNDTASGMWLAEDCYFPVSYSLPLQHHVALQHAVEFDALGNITLTLISDTFLQGVALQTAGLRVSDNYFHLAPNVTRRILFTPTETPVSKFKVSLSALNLAEEIVIRAARPQS